MKNTILILISLFFLSTCQFDKNERENVLQPNIVFILVDDFGWRDVGFNGSTFFETPVLDSLAERGIQFSNAYSNAANCAPTRASIMTGMYTQRHGIITVNASNKGDRKAQKLLPPENTMTLDTATISLAELLKTAGYSTAFFGKWHLGEDPESGPLANGFEINAGGYHMGHPKSYFSPYHNPALDDGPEGEYLTDRLTDEAIAYLGQQKVRNKPFFLYMSYYAVHSPFQAKEEDIRYFESKEITDGQDHPVYAAMIKTMDSNIGRLVHSLDTLGVMDNTLVVFYSDNGGSFRATVNTPLKGSKGMLYEGGIRVPCFFYSPSLLSFSGIIDEAVITLDLYPTFAELAGAKIPEGKIIDGRSLMPLMDGKEKMERPVFWYAPVYLQSQWGETAYAFRGTPSAAVRFGDYKYIRWFAEEEGELYNLAEDISEANNLAGTEREKYEEMSALLDEWLEQSGAFIPTERNPLFDSLYTASTYGRIRY